MFDKLSREIRTNTIGITVMYNGRKYESAASKWPFKDLFYRVCLKKTAERGSVVIGLPGKTLLAPKNTKTLLLAFYFKETP